MQNIYHFSKQNLSYLQVKPNFYKTKSLNFILNFESTIDNYLNINRLKVTTRKEVTRHNNWTLTKLLSTKKDVLLF